MDGPYSAEKLPGHMPGSLIICLAEGDPFLGLADICPAPHIALTVVITANSHHGAVHTESHSVIKA